MWPSMRSCDTSTAGYFNTSMLHATAYSESAPAMLDWLRTWFCHTPALLRCIAAVKASVVVTCRCTSSVSRKHTARMCDTLQRDSPGRLVQTWTEHELVPTARSNHAANVTSKIGSELRSKTTELHASGKGTYYARAAHAR
eukprot:365048-Chlamydomonas_euryale.AAC.21